MPETNESVEWGGGQQIEVSLSPEEVQRRATNELTKCDEALVLQAANLYRMAAQIERLDKLFRKAGLGVIDAWIKDHHPITARVLGQKSRRYQILGIAKAAADSETDKVLLETHNVVRLNQAARLVRNEIAEDLCSAVALLEEKCGVSFDRARINEELAIAATELIAEKKAGKRRRSKADGDMQLLALRRTEPKRKKRDVSKLWEQALFEITVSISAVRRQTAIKWKNLGLNPETTEALERLVHNSPMLSFSEKYDKALGRVRSKLKHLQQKHLTYCDPWWVTDEDTFPKLLEGIVQLEAEIESEKTELLSSYEGEFEQFVHTVSRWVATLELDAHRAKALLTQYVRRFPEPDEIRAGFRLVVGEPKRLPSLAEAARADNELEKEAIERENLSMKRENELALAQMRRRSHTELERIRQALVADVEHKLYGVAAETLEALKKGGDAHVPAAVMRQVRANIAKIEQMATALQHPMAEFTEPLREICKLQSLESERENARTRLDTVFSQLRTEISLEDSLDSREAQNLWECIYLD